jgi:hypothetical protein
MNELDSELLIEHLQSSIRPCYVNRERTHINVRCPYCGDSQKHLDSGHLNIKINDPRCFVWRCVRCSTGGVVNYKFIRDLECFDPFLLEFGFKNSINSKEYIKKKNKELKLFNPKQRELIIPFKESDLSYEKIDYINNRLGLNISPRLACHLRMITDFEEFLFTNHLKATEDETIMKMLQSHAIGFLSWDASMIVFRNIHGKFFGDKRYFNYNIQSKDQINFNKFYSIRKKIDACNPIIKLNLSEGIIDMLGLSFSILKEAPTIRT